MPRVSTFTTSLAASMTILCRGVIEEGAGQAIANPVFGMLKGTARQRRRAALLLAHPDLGSQLRPCYG